MSIKSQGGVFGRNPTFNDVEVEGNLTVDGTLSVGGQVLSGLDFEGAWDATSGAPSATPSTGQFWIVSVAGTTNLSGITNWGIGDWALYDGSAWQRIEGGADGNFSQLTSSSTTVLNGTTIPASKTLLVTTDIGSTVEAYDATILKSADIGSTVQGYDATILTSSDIGSTVQAYDAGTLTSADIGSTVQAYDADTTKNDVSNTFTQDQIFNASVGIGTSSPAKKLHVYDASSQYIQISGRSRDLLIGQDGTGCAIYSNGAAPMYFSTDGTERMRIDSSGRVGINETSPSYELHVVNESDVAKFDHTSTGDTTGIVMRHGRGLSGYSGKMVSFIRYDNTEVGSIRIGASTTAYNTSSDYRLKEDWQPMSGSIDRVKALNPVNFAWKIDGTRVDGFLAHEAQEVVPEAVFGTKDAVTAYGNITDAEGTVVQENVVEPETLEKGQTWTKVENKPNYQSIDQSKLVPLLTAALQEAIARIESLESRVAALDGKSIPSNNVIVAEEII